MNRGIPTSGDTSVAVRQVGLFPSQTQVDDVDTGIRVVYGGQRLDPLLRSRRPLTVVYGRSTVSSRTPRLNPELFQNRVVAPVLP